MKNPAKNEVITILTNLGVPKNILQLKSVQNRIKIIKISPSNHTIARHH